MVFLCNDTPSTAIYTLSLHDALPISSASRAISSPGSAKIASSRGGEKWKSSAQSAHPNADGARWRDRKSTRLNSSHTVISYAVFCLKKKTEDATSVSDGGFGFQCWVG